MTTAFEQVAERAKRFIDAHPEFTKEQAIARFIQRDPSIYDEHLSELGSGLPVMKGTAPVHDMSTDRAGKSVPDTPRLPVALREQADFTPGLLHPATVIKSESGAFAAARLIADSSEKLLKARERSLGQWSIGKITEKAIELQGERPDLGDMEAFASVVLDGTTDFKKDNAVALLWQWINGPESDIDAQIALDRPDIREALKRVRLEV